MSSIIIPANLNLKRKYYVSGPMTGIDDFNFPAFHSACRKLRFAGLTIVSPHELNAPKNLTGEALWRHMMDLCVLQVAKCQATIFLPGWMTSRGARQELEWGLENDHEFYFWTGTLLVDMNRR